MIRIQHLDCMMRLESPTRIQLKANHVLVQKLHLKVHNVADWTHIVFSQSIWWFTLLDIAFLDSLFESWDFL